MMMTEEEFQRGWDYNEHALQTEGDDATDPLSGCKFHYTDNCLHFRSIHADCKPSWAVQIITKENMRMYPYQILSTWYDYLVGKFGHDPIDEILDKWEKK